MLASLTESLHGLKVLDDAVPGCKPLGGNA